MGIIFVFGIVAILFFTNILEPSSRDQGNEIMVSDVQPVLVAARQYQSSEEEILTVTEYDTEVFVIGAGMDRLTLPRIPDSPTSYFSNGKFSLALGDTNVRVWLDDVPYYEGNERYNESSWELILPDTCQRYFDGCNTCQKDSGCTELWCDVYEAPRCLDSSETTGINDAGE